MQVKDQVNVKAMSHDMVVKTVSHFFMSQDQIIKGMLLSLSICQFVCMYICQISP